MAMLVSEQYDKSERKEAVVAYKPHFTSLRIAECPNQVSN
jgi:hypothetical protein